MLPTSKSLFLLTAGDLMTSLVVSVPQEMSLQGAARRLVQFQVSGAPVVDAEGRCVGVLSAADFIRWVGGPARGKSKSADCMCEAWQIFDSAEYSTDETVQSIMTPDPVFVTKLTSVQRLSQMMLDAHIHRLIVVDQDRKPVGIVSSTDVLAAVARGRDFSVGYKTSDSAPTSVRK